MQKCIVDCESIITTIQRCNYIDQKDSILKTLFSQAEKVSVLQQHDSNPEEKLQFIMLIGVPGSGKTTFRHRFIKEHPNYNVLSFDDIIEEYCKLEHLTYDEVYEDDITLRMIDKRLNIKLKDMIQKKSNIICDGTNLSVKSRSRKTSQIGSEYHKKAYVFISSLDKIIQINEARSKIEHNTEYFI
jgi:predicted kinase